MSNKHKKGRPATIVPAPKRILPDLRQLERMKEHAKQEAAKSTNAPIAEIRAPRIIRPQEPDRLYWAYGSNLCENRMKRRCPGAIKVGPLSLDDGTLMFRRVADVVSREGSQIHGGLWMITARHEEELDGYEGVRSGRYMKRYLRLRHKGEEKRCLYYQMRTSNGVIPPDNEYLQIMEEGYDYFGLPMEFLSAAIAEARENKKVTEYLRRCYLERK